MNRSDYTAMRRERHRLIQKIAALREHADMADSRLVVQIDSDSDYIGSYLRKLRGIELMIAPNRDPLGFRAMHRQWTDRRKRAAWAIKCRHHDAEQRARFPSYYAAKERA